MPDRGVFFTPNFGWLFGLLLLTVLAYLPGLNGPFLFDDTPNLVAPFTIWLSGETGWKEMLFGNGSGMLGRPVSMLSFIVNGATTGLDPLPFKLTNLLIHLGCGVLIYGLASRLLDRDPQLNSRARLFALVIAALWLLHPLQVSTVLYVVQRMAQLSALFTLAALLAYVLGRTAIEEGRNRLGCSWLFVALPAATAAAIFSKENGALVPLLCAVIELGYFRPPASTRRPWSVRGFFALFLLLPAAFVLVFLGTHPQRLLDSYDVRLFTLTERLLSEPRALLEYIGALLIPRGPSLGIYTDDFVVSHGLLDPPSTLFAILGLAGLIIAALFARTRIPAFFTGVGLYLAGHAMESTVFPLELYFEHRNYLPSAGFFLAMIGLAGWVAPHLARRSNNPQRAGRSLAIGGCALVVLLGLATAARSSVWGSWPALAQQGASQHPDSLRAQLDYAQVLLEQGRLAEVRGVVTRMASIPKQAAQHFAAIDTLMLDCMEFGAAQPGSKARIAAFAGSKLELADMLAFKVLSDYLRTHAECKGLTTGDMAALITNIVDAAPQGIEIRQIWGSRFDAAELFLRSGQPQLAQQQAELAWTAPGAEPPVGVFLATVYLMNGDHARAQTTIATVKGRLASWDRRGHQLIADLEQRLPPTVSQPAPIEINTNQGNAE